MTNSIEIENYKSIKHLKLETARVNVFIGEPNSGKSNILEALGLLSQGGIHSSHFSKLFRFNSIADLFYDSDTSEDIKVAIDEFELKLGKGENGALQSQFVITFTKSKGIATYNISFDGKSINGNGSFESPLRYYSFDPETPNVATYLNVLDTPYGGNIPNLLITNPSLRKLVSEIFKRKDLRLQLNAVENTMGAAKEVEEVIHTYSYKAVSETLRRLIFYKLAIATNENCSLIFDEPEANTFPIYTKEIGEMIAMNGSNQFFITTHNPYLLRSIITKTPRKELKVFVTNLKNYKTECRALTDKELSEVLDMDMDFFFNLPE